MNQLIKIQIDQALENVCTSKYFDVAALYTVSVFDVSDWQDFRIFHCVHYNTMPQDRIEALWTEMIRQIQTKVPDYQVPNGMKNFRMEILTS